jgi:hypothetical protein
MLSESTVKPSDVTASFKICVNFVKSKSKHLFYILYKDLKDFQDVAGTGIFKKYRSFS